MKNPALLGGRVLLGIGGVVFLGCLTVVLVLLFGKYAGGNAWPDVALSLRGQKSVADLYSVKMSLEKIEGRLVHNVSFRYKDESGNYRTGNCRTNDYPLVSKMGYRMRLPVTYDPKVFRRARVDGCLVYMKTPLLVPFGVGAAAGLGAAIAGGILIVLSRRKLVET